MRDMCVQHTGRRFRRESPVVWKTTIARALHSFVFRKRRFKARSKAIRAGLVTEFGPVGISDLKIYHRSVGTLPGKRRKRNFHNFARKPR